jgi:hypothetical protein
MESGTSFPHHFEVSLELARMSLETLVKNSHRNIIIESPLREFLYELNVRGTTMLQRPFHYGVLPVTNGDKSFCEILTSLHNGKSPMSSPWLDPIKAYAIFVHMVYRRWEFTVPRKPNNEVVIIVDGLLSELDGVPIIKSNREEVKIGLSNVFCSVDTSPLVLQILLD